jgi:hypothetical protein
LRCRRGQLPRSALRARRLWGFHRSRRGQIPAPTLGASRCREFTAPGAARSTARAPRQSWWGSHRSRRGQFPGPRSAPAAVGISPLQTAIACAIRSILRRPTAQPSPKNQFFAVRAFAGHRSEEGPKNIPMLSFSALSALSAVKIVRGLRRELPAPRFGGTDACVMRRRVLSSGVTAGSRAAASLRTMCLAPRSRI